MCKKALNTNYRTYCQDFVFIRYSFGLYMSTLSISFEHEEKKQQEELLSHYFKFKTPRECQKTNINAVKIGIQWRNLLREAKIKELRCDINNMRQTFQRTLDHKDAIIEFLKKELDDIEVQRLYNINSHMHNLKDLIAFEEERMQNLRLNYIKNRSELRKQFLNVQLKMVQSYKEKMSELDNMAYDNNFSLVRRLQEDREIQCAKLESIEQKGEKERITLDLKYDNRVEKIWQQLQASFQLYLMITSKRSKLFSELKAKHEETVDHITKKQEDLEILNGTVAILKAETEKARKEHEEKISNLKMEKRALWERKLEEQQQMRKLQHSAKKELVVLVNKSHKVEKHLKRLTSKGNSILKQAKLCRTFEDDSDNKPPMYTSFLSQSDVRLLKKELFTFTDQPIKEVEKICYSLDQFWIHYSNVAIQNMALEKELADLHSENQKLQKQLKMFLASYGHQKNNARFLPYTSHVTSRGNTVQEATHIVKYM